MLKQLILTFILLAVLGLALPASAQEADVNQQAQIENFLHAQNSSPAKSACLAASSN